MGMNYYLQKYHFERGPNPHPRMHIGKSSVGWCFQLHVIPEEGLNDWEDWHSYIRRHYDHEIVDEEGRGIRTAELWYIVTQRRAKEPPATTGTFAERGPNNLLRSPMVGLCIGHGSGTWDLISGEFR